MNRAIAWWAENHVVANLLMALIVAGGLLTIPQVTKEVFPEFTLDMVMVQVPYLGAAPEEVEEGVCIKIEEAVQDLEGIKKIESTAAEGMGSVLIELKTDVDQQKTLSDIKTRVDAISTFPAETEKPIITDITNRRQVIDVAISGNVDEMALKAIGERVRDELLAIEGITQVVLVASRPYEVSIEVSEESLRRHNITFDFVADAVRRSSLDLPGGTIRTDGGEILLRTKGQAYRGREFAELVLVTRPDGTRLLLGDVARVVDGFAETDQSARFAGERAVNIRVFRVGDQDPLELVATVKEYVAAAQERMPEGVTLTAWQDYARVLQGRIDLMVRSARSGYILVFIILALFLRFRLAWWVSLGIPISFLGGFWLMPMTGVTINMLSLFAFIVVLGIVVDDAIVVGENIYKQQEMGEAGVEASIKGTLEVATPVIFGVLTTIAAFSPLLYVVGMMGKFMRVIPIIVIVTLIFSLVESLLILPAHLAHAKKGGEKKTGPGAQWRRFQDAIARRPEWFVERVYRPSLRIGLKYRYATVAFALVSLMLTAAVLGAGWMKFVFFPHVESDYLVASLTMPAGNSVENTADAIRGIESAALQLREELEAETPEGERNPILYVFTSIGEQPRSADQATPGADWFSFSGSHLGEVLVELIPSEERSLTSEEIVSRWRDLSPPVPDAVELSYSATLFSAGDPINVQLAGTNLAHLESASQRIKSALEGYTGVFDITDNYRSGKREVKLAVKPAAQAYGVTLADLARQVRQAFYGEEVQRIQRGRDEVRVMVRFPADQRRSIGDLENMRIRTRDGGEVPFSLVAEASAGRGFSSIRRVERKRSINVTADLDQSKANAQEIVTDLRKNVLPGIIADYPGVTYSFEGEQREQAETMSGLVRGFLMALLVIYMLMAIPFKSYIQPLIIMSIIPFGFVGAVWGHLLMGLDLTILSMFGLVALTGVVVNDSIVLVHFINERRREGSPLAEAVQESGVRRFRPILLTSLTTFAGVLPLLVARSVQAKFLVPMAVSLGFGVLFATFITMMLVPVSYLILEDVKRAALRILGRPITGVEGARAEGAVQSVGGQQ